MGGDRPEPMPVGGTASDAEYLPAGKIRRYFLHRQHPRHTIFPPSIVFMVGFVCPAPVTQAHPRIAMGPGVGRNCGQVRYRLQAPITSAALLPPNPKEFERTVSIGLTAGCITGSSRKSGSGWRHPNCGRNQSLGNTQSRNHRLDGTGGGQGMSKSAFDRRQQRLLPVKKGVDGRGFGKIIIQGAGTMQVNVVDIRYRNSGILNGGLHGRQGAFAPGMRCHRVISVTGQAGSEDPATAWPGSSAVSSSMAAPSATDMPRRFYPEDGHLQDQ